MLFQAHAARAAERLRDELPAPRDIAWPWPVLEARVRVRGTDLTLSLVFVADVQIRRSAPGAKTRAQLVIPSVVWRMIGRTLNTKAELRAVLSSALREMLTGIRQEAERAGHPAVVARVDRLMEGPAAVWVNVPALRMEVAS